MVTFVSLAKTAESIKMQFLGLTRVGPRNRVLIRWGRDPTGTDHFLGLSGPLKSIVSHCCVVRCKNQSRRHSATATADCNAANWSMPHYIVPREKSAPCDVAFDHLFISAIDYVGCWMRVNVFCLIDRKLQLASDVRAVDDVYAAAACDPQQRVPDDDD